MIQKTELKGKYVEYLEKQGKASTGKRRIELVVKVTGSWLTVRNVLGRRRRIHRDQVLCRMRPKLGAEDIEWNGGKTK